MIVGVALQRSLILLEGFLRTTGLPKQIRVIELDVDVVGSERNRFLQIFFCGSSIVESGFNQCAQPEVFRTFILLYSRDLIQRSTRSREFSFGGQRLFVPAVMLPT